MPNERASIGLEEDAISIEELATANQQNVKPTPKQQAKIYKEAEKLGFVSRQPIKRRKVSPYTDQFGGKCREGMKALFQDIGEHLGCYNTETLERAILALIEKEGLDDLAKRYKSLVE